MTISVGDKVIICESWDYGPPADPYTEYLVTDVGDAYVRIYVHGHVCALPVRCVRKPEPITFGDLCGFFGVFTPTYTQEQADGAYWGVCQLSKVLHVQ